MGFGIGVTRATILSEDISGGDVGYENTERLGKRIICLPAGYAAPVRRYPRSENRARRGAVSDFERAREAQCDLGKNPNLPADYNRWFMLELPSNPRHTALAIAILADVLQIVFFPMFVEGAFSPLDDLLDIAVAWMLIRLLGWHWAFLPSFVAKVVPGVDLVPTWTMAVLVAMRGTPRERAKIEPPIIEGRP